MALTYPAFVNNDRVVRAAANAPWMKRGERGPAVAILQAALIDVGYPMPISTRKTGSPDGIYGGETYSTVLRFQTQKGLSGKDGIAGRETFTRLDALLTASAPVVIPLPPPPPPLPPANRDYTIGTADPRITPDRGAGVWDSEPTTVTARVQKGLIMDVLPTASVVIGDDAASHMLHYMLNTGTDYTIDFEGMVAEVSTARGRFRNEVSQAKTFVESLPVGTHQITSRSAEIGYNRKTDSTNWYFAIGGYSTWGKGRATVRNGSAGREYELEFEYKFYDRYNWDTGKKVTIGPVTITDHFMGEFHRQGIAREFDCVGSFRRSFSWRDGEAIPSQQYQPPGGR